MNASLPPFVFCTKKADGSRVSFKPPTVPLDQFAAALVVGSGEFNRLINREFNMRPSG